MGFSKSGPYGAEEPPPERQLPDLLTNQTVSPDHSFERPPAYVPPPPPVRTPPRRFRRRPSSLPALVLVLGLALVIGSCLGGWWTMTVSEPNQEGTLGITFLLGSQYGVTCSGGSACSEEPTGSLSYSDHSLGPVGDLYAGALTLMVAALVAAVLTAMVALAGALGYWTTRMQFLLALLLGLLTIGLLLGATLSVAGLQPSALGQAGGGFAPNSAPSPATSFWGSCSGGGSSQGACSSSGGTVTASWGPGVGWYLGVLGALVFVFGLILHLRARPVRGSAV